MSSEHRPPLAGIEAAPEADLPPAPEPLFEVLGARPLRFAATPLLMIDLQIELQHRCGRPAHGPRAQHLELDVGRGRWGGDKSAAAVGENLIGHTTSASARRPSKNAATA